MASEHEKDQVEMKLGELAERSGVPARTIRLYIAQGLLPGPLRAGRNAAYGVEHIKTLAAIRELQRQGLTLSQIHQKMAAPGEVEATLPAPEQTLTYLVAPDVTVSVRGDSPPWRLRAIQRALSELQRSLATKDDVRDNA